MADAVADPSVPGAARSAFPWVVFALAFALLLSDFMCRQVLAAVFPFLKAEWVLSDTELGALRRPQVVLTLLVGVVGFGGMFAVYSYIAPLATDVAGISRAAIPAVLLVYGIGGVLGTALGGRLADLALFRSLVGVSEVTAAQVATTGLHRMETEDYAAALVRLGNGGPGSILATTAACPGAAAARLIAIRWRLVTTGRGGRCSASAARCAAGTVTCGCTSRRGCAAAGATAAGTASWRRPVRQD